MKKILVRLWAFPNTALGLLFALPALIGGGRAGFVGGTLEVYGGLLAGLLRRWPPAGAAAVTLGHVILGMSARDLEEFRAHERVHVRQCERWGPLFLPTYAVASVWAWVTGRDPYLANRFEREALERATDPTSFGPGRSRASSSRARGRYSST